GETGFVCRSVDEMVAAVERVEGIDRAACRRRAETCFSAEAMADGYEAVYRQMVAAAERPVEDGLLVPDRTVPRDALSATIPVTPPSADDGLLLSDSWE
ncbi:MAG: hypothetical protein IRY97_08115, partial [Thermomicrobiaceae bacterium]|nr:hypothetical protein [Thermomicrobiaceae bacterium]